MDLCLSICKFPVFQKTDHFLHFLNACAVPSQELTCGEYCFRHPVNPGHPPSLDPNTHRLTSMLMALSNTCGGVLYLDVNEQTVHGETEFSLFKSQLLSLPDIRESLVEISQGGDKSSWAIIAAKISSEPLFCNVENEAIELRIDLKGHVREEKNSLKGKGQEI